jgi:hypothetical protein
MKKSVIALSALFLVYSCTKTVQLNLNTTASQLVIQGTVSDTSGPYQVLISQSVGFYDNSIYPSVSGASVTIADSTTGITDQLTETSPGVYSTHTIVGHPGDTYLLTAQVNGKTYTASSTMPQPVPLDSVTFDNQSIKNTIRAVSNFQDPVQYTNYYSFTQYVNGKDLQEVHTFEDRLSNGRYIREKMDNDTSDIKNGDTVQLFLIGIDYNVYTFLSEAENIAYNNDNLVAPATPTSNITGGCLGYFSAQTVSSKKGIVKF